MGRVQTVIETAAAMIFVLDNNYAQVGLNWGIGALAYVAAAVVLSGAISKLGPASKEESDLAG